MTIANAISAFGVVILECRTKIFLPVVFPTEKSNVNPKGLHLTVVSITAFVIVGKWSSRVSCSE